MAKGGKGAGNQGGSGKGNPKPTPKPPRPPKTTPYAPLGRFTSSYLLNRNQVNPPSAFDRVKSVYDKVDDKLTKVGSAFRKSTLGIAATDVVESVDSFLKKSITIDGAAASRVKALLNPNNNNGISIKDKLEVSKMNAKLRDYEIPERHIEKATLAYLEGLKESEGSGSDVLAKQYYITSLKVSGIDTQFLHRIMNNARTLDEKDWKKVLIGLGVGIGTIGAGYLIGKGIKNDAIKKVGALIKKYGPEVIKGAGSVSR